VAGGTPGDIFAAAVGTIEVDRGYGPDVLQIDEAGIQRRVEATVPSDPYPLLPNPPQAPTDSPAGVTFQFIYEGEGTGLANPQLTIRADNTASTAPDQYDLSLVTDNDVAKFNLARLDSIGVSGIRNVAVEGDLLTAITAVANNFFTPGAASDPPGGIRLPSDALAGIAIRDEAPSAGIQAKSIQAVAFGSHSAWGRTFTGADSWGGMAADLLAPGTAIVPANDTFRVPFADQPNQQVAFFFDSAPYGGYFDDRSLVLTVQNLVEWNGVSGAGMANVTTPSNAARGAVTALIQIVQPVDAFGYAEPSQVRQVAFDGDGASLSTWQPITGSITSTGPLGDLRLNEGYASSLDITAPSIFGSVDLGGSLSGVVQTTGLRIDPITGATSQIPADLGRLFVKQTYFGPVLSDTTFQVEGGLLHGGELLVGGNLVSQTNIVGGISGTLAVLGDITGEVTVDGDLTGQVIVLGTIATPGGLAIHGGLRDGGVLAVQGDVSGPLEIDGGIDPSSALIAGGNLGSVAAPLAIHGAVRGIFAALGDVTTNWPLDSRHALFYGVSLSASSNSQAQANAAAIDAAFSALDAEGIDFSGKSLLVDLVNGELSLAIVPTPTTNDDRDGFPGFPASSPGNSALDQVSDEMAAPFMF
ncbi:MAG TPA: hypothetical protein VF278_20380, partial [Pirellulales bacterium]